MYRKNQVILSIMKFLIVGYYLCRNYRFVKLHKTNTVKFSGQHVEDLF